MSLGELLRVKMDDYGYGSVRELAAALGISGERLESLMQSAQADPEIEERAAISRVLDVDPGVLLTMMERPGLRKYEIETLTAFKRHGMRAGETARALYVDPTTVSYRLRIIEKRTGINPRDPAGLKRLLA